VTALQLLAETMIGVSAAYQHYQIQILTWEQVVPNRETSAGTLGKRREEPMEQFHASATANNEEESSRHDVRSADPVIQKDLRTGSSLPHLRDDAEEIHKEKDPGVRHAAENP